MELVHREMLGFVKRLLGGARNDVYGLDHAVLNVQLPPQSMWMNMGYWEVGLISKQSLNSTDTL